MTDTTASRKKNPWGCTKWSIVSIPLLSSVMRRKIVLLVCIGTTRTCCLGTRLIFSHMLFLRKQRLHWPKAYQGLVPTDLQLPQHPGPCFLLLPYTGSGVKLPADTGMDRIVIVKVVPCLYFLLSHLTLISFHDFGCFSGFLHIEEPIHAVWTRNSVIFGWCDPSMNSRTQNKLGTTLAMTVSI